LRRVRWAGHIAHMGDIRNSYKIFVGKPEGRRPLGRPRCMWEDNTEMDLRNIGYKGVNFTHQAEDRDQWWAL